MAAISQEQRERWAGKRRGGAVGVSAAPPGGRYQPSPGPAAIAFYPPHLHSNL